MYGGTSLHLVAETWDTRDGIGVYISCYWIEEGVNLEVHKCQCCMPWSRVKNCWNFTCQCTLTKKSYTIARHPVLICSDATLQKHLHQACEFGMRDFCLRTWGTCDTHCCWSFFWKFRNLAVHTHCKIRALRHSHQCWQPYWEGGQKIIPVQPGVTTRS